MQRIGLPTTEGMWFRALGPLGFRLRRFTVRRARVHGFRDLEFFRHSSLGFKGFRAQGLRQAPFTAGELFTERQTLKSKVTTI